MEVRFKPSFIRAYKGLDPQLQEEVKEKIALFRDGKNHIQLRVHRLKGSLAGRYSFSVNYRYRIVFMYQGKDTAILLAIGDHDVYT
ncbi:MAG TPA: type II toxin-antitoxin system RelE/ParE family toxin [Patescibacteria group bacterium]|nr:type II toxin-antitoxin system RelE/ParE family toxin [Patescibacteria group bacterium]